MADTLAPPTTTTAVWSTTLHDPSGAGDARRAVLQWMHERRVSATTQDDVLLVVSELVTNSVRCTVGSVQLGLATLDDGVLVEVFDESSRAPSAVRAAPDATRGRGLAIVEAIATRWGARDEIGDLCGATRLGKVVWAVVPWS